MKPRINITVTFAPTLQTRYSGYGKSLTASVVTGILGCLAVAGLLALIVQVHLMVTETNTEVPEELTVKYQQPQKKKPVTPVTSAPERLITVSTGAPMVQAETEEVPTQKPEFVEVPEPPQPDLIVLDELDDNNPFEEKKPEPKKETRTAETETQPAPRSGPSRAELEERERRRRAALARQVVRDAKIAGSRVTPHYPRSARRDHLEGRVVIKVTVGPDGRVSQCQITQSSGHSVLDQSALDAARRHRFIPAQNGLGQAVSVKKLMPFSFRLAG